MSNRPEPEGWWLPQADTYFRQFVPPTRYKKGAPGKNNGFQREHLLAAFRHVQKWQLAVDVGAHVGWWTWDMAAEFEAVHAFEAAPDTFACLERNTIDLPNVRIHHAAVGAATGGYTVVEDPTRKGNTGSRYVKPGDGPMQMVKLDSFNFPACDLLKVDVEGYELQALQGAEWTIAEYRPVVVMETDKPFAKARYGVPDDAAEKFLLERGYREVEHMRPDKVFVWDE